MLNGAAISWRSKRQAIVSLSSAGSEFIAASQSGQEVVYLREILKGFGAEQDSCTRIFEDNQACIAMSENTVHRSEPRGRTSLRCRVAPTAKAALELRSSSRTDQQLSNCKARAGQRSNWKADLELHGSGQAALELQ